MVNVVEKALYVYIDAIVELSVIDEVLHSKDCIFSASIGSKAVAVFMEFCFTDRF
jgi:hypothetical protein